MFRSRLLTGANTVQILMIATMYGFQFIGALYIQRVLGFGELATGFAFLPAPVAIGILMMCLSARATGRFGAYRVLLAGLVLITVGMALLSRAPVHGSYVTDVLPPMLLLAAGFAAAMPPLTGLAMSGAREEDAGLLGRDAQLVPATTQGYQLAFRTAALVAAGALVPAAAVLRPRTEPVRD